MNKPPTIEELVSAAESGDIGAQYNLGVCYLRGDGVDRDAKLASHWLERAAEADLAAAQLALGYLHLRAHGVVHDTARAAALFRRASEQGLAEAIYKHAEFVATGLGCPQDSAAARAEFSRGAEAGQAMAQCQLAYCLDEGIGGVVDPVAATEWLFRAAIGGLPRAAAAIAERYRTGHTLQPDAVRALAWFLRAESAGYPGSIAAVAEMREQLDAARIASALALSRAAPIAEPASSEHLFERKQVETKLISGSPHVATLENLLSAAECWHLMALALPLLRPSQVLSSKAGEAVRAAGRSSGGMSIVAPLRDVVVWNIERRLATITELPLANGEPLSILRYGIGDEYRPHCDFFDPQVPGQAVALENGGQRLATVLMYLCDVEGGGATEFPDAGITVSPQRGTGVFFHNCTPDGAVDRASRHAGATVRQGQKWLATKWIRERVFDEYR